MLYQTELRQHVREVYDLANATLETLKGKPRSGSAIALHEIRRKCGEWLDYWRSASPSETRIRYANDFLFVCTGCQCRSPTAEHVARTLGLHADSAGTGAETSLRPLTREAIERARRVVCMEESHKACVLEEAPERAGDVEVWGIPDIYKYCNPRLIEIVKEKLTGVGPNRYAEVNGA